MSEPEVVSTLDYMLRSLEGKYEKEIVENDVAVMHSFSLSGKLMMEVVISKKTQRIKLTSSQGVEVVDRLDSVEQVEDLLRRML